MYTPQKNPRRVSYLPACIPEDMNPYVGKSADPLFGTIHDYMEKIDNRMGLDTVCFIDGNEIVIETGKDGTP